VLVLHQSPAGAEAVLIGRLDSLAIVQQLHTPVPLKLLYRNDLVLLICFCWFYQLAQPYSVVRLHYIIVAWPFKFINTVHSLRFLCYNCIFFKWFFCIIYIIFICWQYRSPVSFSVLGVFKKNPIINFIFTPSKLCCAFHMSRHLSYFSPSGYNLSFSEHTFSFFELFFYCLQSESNFIH